jgi:hypothetical protein
MGMIYRARITVYAQATSSSSVAIGTGSKTFTLTKDIRFVEGMSVTADAGGGNTALGTITSYDSSTLQAVINVTSITGAGTFTSWVIGGTTELRFCTGRGYSHPSGGKFYAPRIKQAANIKRSILDDLRTYGSSRIAGGELVLVNTDRALDYMLEYGYGRTIEIDIGDESDNDGTFTTFLNGIIEQPEFSINNLGSQLSLRYRDRQQELDLPVQVAKFAGTNSGATGIEGTADTIMGQNKPRLWGARAPNIRAVLLNSSSLIYGVNFGRGGSTAAVSNIHVVYDEGVALGAGTDYANLAALQAAVIAAGQYATCLAEGLFRLGSKAAGIITCDVTQSSTTAGKHIAGVINALLLDAGVSSGDISSSDITALEADAPYDVYYYVESEDTTYRQILDKIAASAFVWYGPNKSGVYQIKQLTTPAGSPVFTFKRFSNGVVAKISEGDIISIERVATKDSGRGVPFYRINANYALVSTKQTAADLAASVTDERRSYLTKGFLSVTSPAATDAAGLLLSGAIRTLYNQSQELTVDTQLITAADAQAIADDRFTFYGTRHDSYNLKIKIGTTLLSAVDLGSIVQLRLPFLGLSTGKLAVITEIEYDAATEIMAIQVLT